MEIHVIALKTAGPMAGHLRHPRARVHALQIKSPADLAGWARFVRLLRRLRPDIVHAHMTLSNLATRAARLLAPAAVVVNHEHGLGMWKGRALCLLDGATQGLADRVITVSDASRKIRISRERINPARIITMHNATDWVRWSNVTPVRQGRGLTLGVAASLTRVKRIDVAIRMLAALRARRSDARLLVAGDGPELSPLRKVSRELGVHSCVEFLGFVQDMAEFYSKVDVVLLTSLREDCPMALLEALAAGKFVVGPATGGARELLQAPVEGAILEDATDFSPVLQRLQDLPAGFDSPGNRDYARRFDITEYAQKIVSLYEELAGPRR
jgi:glycosyltransferase involved in cell wall biosynthesis